MGINITKTSRGFFISKFMDRYDKECKIQKSYLATEDCIWLGRQDVCMHLTQDMVKDLLPLLERFVETGELYNINETTNTQEDI